MINGILNIYKEKGFTSHDVVAKLRGILGQKKIGHTGTLDPEAEGVLPICLGKGTKLASFLTEKEKEYETVLKFGIETDTQDLTGKIIKESPVTMQKEKISEVIKSFVGEYDQIPPMYSAIKINGKRLYELAREGKTVERKKRSIHIYSIDILEIKEQEQEVVLRVACSKGTYIRTLCHDIGEALGYGGAMKELKRTRSGQFEIKDSLTLSEVSDLLKSNQLGKYLMEVDQMFLKYRAVYLSKENCKQAYNGNIINPQMLLEPIEGKEQEKVRVYDNENKFIGIYQFDQSTSFYRPYKMFYE